jgi:hypothetical protein
MSAVLDWIASELDIRNAVSSDLDATLSAYASKIAEEARSRCPVRTGELKASIGVVKRDGGYDVVATSPHAHLVEFGHDEVKGGRKVASKSDQAKGVKPGTVIGHVPPHPFMRPAVNAVVAGGPLGDATTSIIGEIGGAAAGAVAAALGFPEAAVTVRHLTKLVARKYGKKFGLAAGRYLGSYAGSYVPPYLLARGIGMDQGDSAAVRLRKAGV